jgi:hypothetical protein
MARQALQLLPWVLRWQTIRLVHVRTQVLTTEIPLSPKFAGLAGLKAFSADPASNIHIAQAGGIQRLPPRNRGNVKCAKGSAVVRLLQAPGNADRRSSNPQVLCITLFYLHLLFHPKKGVFSKKSPSQGTANIRAKMHCMPAAKSRILTTNNVR